MADYEDFDPAPYQEPEPGRGEGVVHDVPEGLLDGEMEGSGIEQTLQGYRIQIFSSPDKAAADRQVEEVLAWWRTSYREGTLQEAYPGDASTPAVDLVYLQPYFRIRLGNFASRQEAQQVLSLVQQQFSGAFIVPDTVTIRR